MTALIWRRVDDYHVRSQCGRFSVARMCVDVRMWYVAWKLAFDGAHPSTELGATSLPITANDAERIAAIHEMQDLCEAAA